MNQFKPDINCSGHDALQEAIERISNGSNKIQKDNPFSMNDLLKHLQSMVMDVQSLRRQVAQIRTQNAPQKINNILTTQSQAGKEQIFQSNLANNPTRLSPPER